VSGRDLTTGLPRRVEVSGKEIREAAEAQVAEIIDAVRKTLDACPPELAGDIMNTGIVLMGGGSLLKGLEERLRQEVQMPVEVAKDPLTCVVRGAGACLQEFDSMKAVLVGDTARYH
jgi:rod shape-determining protein MreB